MRRIVGISGKAGSGKDYVGRLLAREYGFKIFSFAHALKLEGIAHGFTHEEVFISKPPHVRQWLQEYGVARREEDSEYWIKRALQIISVMGWKDVVFTDVRFPNEAVACLLMSPRSWILRMDPQDRPYPLAGTEAANHISETAMDDYPGFMHLIGNGKCVCDNQLRTQLNRILQ